ncbi:MAG: MOSC domain-containing protein [Fimbriimonadaceae bacterium]
MPNLRVVSVFVGMPQAHLEVDPRDDKGRAWSSGIFKGEVAGPVMVRTGNLDGDGQADLRVHGGPDRAVLMFASSNYTRFGSTEPGSFGENLTVEGVDEDTVCLGDQWGNDRLLFEVSQPRLPCFKLGRRQGNPGIVAEVLKARSAGWYLRVLREGEVQAGDELELVSRPHPEWPIRRAVEAYLQDDTSLLAVAALSQLWRDKFS